MPLVIHDLRRAVPSSTDLEALELQLTALVDQPVVNFRITYPDELVLDLGAVQTYQSPKLAGKSRGAFVLGTVASSWRLQLPDPPYILERRVPPEEDASDPLTTDQKREIQQLGTALHGRLVASVAVRPDRSSSTGADGIRLTIRFSDDSTFAIIPSPSPDEPPDGLPDWELLTPFAHELRAGPGLRWSYLPFHASVAANAGPSIVSG